MKKFGLLGEKLGHSFSPQIHKMLGGYDYGLFEVAPQELDAFMRRADFDGINVTIPYKKAVVPYCASLSETARQTGSVNTIVKLRDGSLYGDNTDCFGFAAMLRKHAVPVGGKVLVLGDGGVAPSIKAALSVMGADEIITVSRRGDNNYVNLSRHYDAKLIVNATPVGMYPGNGERLIGLERFTACRGVADVIYNPLRTGLVLDAGALGIPACGGLYMLVAQAARSCELFTGSSIDEQSVDEVYITLLNSVKTIVLIGMPGCGKTTVAGELGALLGRPVFDCDEELVKRCGMGIPEYISRFGKGCFRELETAVLAELGKKSGVIIATGGGVVMRERNYDILRQNGDIVFLRREVSVLPVDGRPISQAGPLSVLADFRTPLYERWCDHEISGSSAHECAIKIKEALSL